MPATSTKQKILTVDDEVAIVDLIVDILESHNYQAIRATKWTDALHALTHENPDLILLDLKMPTIHGTSMLEFIRSQGFDIPVIVVSGFVTQSVSEELRRQGVRSIIHKPFKGRDLILEIERALGKSQTNSHSAPLPASNPPQHNAMNALYNRPLTAIPEPDENSSVPSSMDALYGTQTHASETSPTQAETRALFQNFEKTAPATKQKTTPEQDILSALQKAKPASPDSGHKPPAPSVAPPADLLEALQKRELEKKDLPASIDMLLDNPVRSAAPAKAPQASTPANQDIPLANNMDPLLGVAPKREAQPTNSLGLRESSYPSRPRRRMAKGNVLFMGGITIVCILIAGFLAIMQWVSAEFDPSAFKQQTQDAISNQVKDEILRELQKSNQALPQKK